MIKTILNLLRSDAYITVNKNLACHIGLAPATAFSELAAKYHYFSEREELKLDGYFYCTIADLSKNTGLTKDEQETAINKLVKVRLLEKKVLKLKGDEGPKRYFKITQDIALLSKYLGNPDIPGFEEKPKTEEEIKVIPSQEISKNDFGNPEKRKEEIPQNDFGFSATNKNNNIIINHENEISQSVSLDTEALCQTTDGQTSTPHPIQSPEKPMPVCEVTEAEIKQQIGYSALATLGDTSLLDEVVLNMLDMYHSSGVKIKDEVKLQAIVHSVLSKVTYWHIVYLLDRFKQVTTPIKNKKSYLQTMIYNSVLEQQAHFTNEVQVDQLAWAKELQPDVSQGHKQYQGTSATSQRDNFDQREYTDKELGRFYADLT